MNAPKSDSETTLEELKTFHKDFVKSRKWNEQIPHNTAISIAIEAAELLEHFQWTESPRDHEEIEAELADVFIYLLSFAYQTNIDLSQAFYKKMEHNAKKFPVAINDTPESYYAIKKAGDTSA